MKQCIIYEEKLCDHCQDCERCERNPEKVCDNCCECLEAKDEYLEVPLSFLHAEQGAEQLESFWQYEYEQEGKSDQELDIEGDDEEGEEDGFTAEPVPVDQELLEYWEMILEQDERLRCMNEEEGSYEYEEGGFLRPALHKKKPSYGVRLKRDRDRRNWIH